MGIIMDILKELPLSSVLREKVLGLESAMSKLEAKYADSQRENTILIGKIQKIDKENAILKKRIKDTDEEPPDYGDVEPV